MNQQDTTPSRNFAGAMFLAVGIVCIVFSVLYNHYSLSLISRFFSYRVWHWISSNLLGLEIPSYQLGFGSDQATSANIVWVQICYFLVGIIFVSLALVAKNVRRARRFANMEIVLNLSISVLSVALPLFILEAALYPFHKSKTTIFMSDPNLGWKLRPNAEDTWGRVLVKVNGKGLIGPELDYEKPIGVRRILFLGDSVTFGYKLANYNESFPFQTELVLERVLGGKIQVINAGVGGYSPWQEYAFLKTEGIKYEPDLVVMAFVLNDLTEKLHLQRFGGSGTAFQLLRTARSSIDRWTSKSAVLTIAKKAVARIRFGRDVQKGAQRQEVIDVKTILLYPEHRKSRKAWEITLKNVKKIFDFCDANNIPAMMVIFPFTFQLKNPRASAPQQKLMQFAGKHHIHALDLLPLIKKSLGKSGLKTEDYFLDYDHPSALGSRVIAEFIADAILVKGLLER